MTEQQTKMEATPLKVGSHVFRPFGGLDAAFGADLKDYPKKNDIPETFMRGDTVFNKAASGLFFKGGKISDYGLQLKPNVDAGQFYAAVRALLCSFAPQHEVKEGTVAWLFSEYTEPMAEGRAIASSAPKQTGA